MAGKHEICNVALGLLGADPIQSFDDGSYAGQVCANVYETAVLAVLEDHPWNFAEAVASLGADATAYRPDFAYSYNLPTGYIAARMLMTPQGRRSRCPWKISGNKLCTDLADAWLVYTYRAPEQLFSPQFSMSLAKYLASLLAGPITESESKVDAWYRVYRDELAIARSRDSQKDHGDPVDTSALVAVHSSD